MLVRNLPQEYQGSRWELVCPLLMAPPLVGFSTRTELNIKNVLAQLCTYFMRIVVKIFRKLLDLSLCPDYTTLLFQPAGLEEHAKQILRLVHIIGDGEEQAKPIFQDGRGDSVMLACAEFVHQVYPHDEDWWGYKYELLTVFLALDGIKEDGLGLNLWNAWPVLFKFLETV